METNPEVTILDWIEWFNLGDRDSDYGRIGRKSGKWLIPPHSGIDEAHVVMYYIAPTNGLYSAPELDEFMMGLVPRELKPSYMLHFNQGSGYVEYRQNPITDGDVDIVEGRHYFTDELPHNRGNEPLLIYGELIFKEKVGERKTSTRSIDILTDEELLNLPGFVNGQRTVDTEGNFDFERGIVIRPFPSEAIGRDTIYPVGNDRLLPHTDIRLKELRRYQSQPPRQGLVQRLS